MDNHPKYGEIKCQTYKKCGVGEQCTHGAYYYSQGKYVCGQHSDKNDRIILDKNKALKKDDSWKLLLSLRSNRKGNIILSKMSMMKKVEDIENYVKIFPNYRHENRTDGIGMSNLSPMKLGPVIHSQPLLPPALLLENFHQGNKCFASEVDEKYDPKDEFYINQYKFYTDSEPHRHKISGENPLYSVWYIKENNGKILGYKIEYIESRQFYCNFYHRLAEKTEEFKKLKEYHESGINLQICGYDAYPMTYDNIESEYLNPRYPFGHERVLMAMLLLNQKDYPWIKYKTYQF